jgi:hypothetical protein
LKIDSKVFTFASKAMVVLMAVVDELLDVFDVEYGYVQYFHESEISNLKNASDSN